MDSKVLKTVPDEIACVNSLCHLWTLTDSHSCLSAGARASQDSKSTVVLSDREHMAVPGSLLQSRPIRRQGAAGETLNKTYFLQLSLHVFYSRGFKV